MIKKMDNQSFDRVYAIMEASFPSDERRPYDEQKCLLNEPRYSVYTLDDEPKGFICSWDFDDFVFIEHFAIDNKYRNLGLGSEFLCDFIAMQKKPVCLEVEPPDTDIAKRRIGFYERNGFFLNEYDYFQPPISKGKNIVPLMIMISKGKIIKEVFENIRDTLYREVYKYEQYKK